MRRWQFLTCFTLCCGALVYAPAQASTDVETSQHRAWGMLQRAAAAKHTGERTNGIRALGLLSSDERARQLAEGALKDSRFQVRSAAATSLGQMHATESIPKLKQALRDRKIAVVMAAARSLHELKDDGPAYDLYYEVLTGERKSSDGVIAQQMETLHDPKQLAMIGVSEGIGFVPFAGIGWDAWRTLHKPDPNPARAVAAGFLAHDPDPDTGKALLRATRDRNPIVRAAAVEALSQRGDPSVLSRLQLCLFDKNERVRYTAAAAVIHLNSIEQNRSARNDRR
jgi:HEAT repeat protein